MRDLADLLTLPTTILGVTVAIVCALIGYVMMASRSTSDNNIKKSRSLVDISTSLQKEESLSNSTASPNDRVLNPIQFRKFKVLKVSRVSHNTKLIRFEIPHGRSLGLTIGKHISIQASLDGNRVIRAYTPSSPINQMGYFDLVIKAYEYGKMSAYLHSLKIGQEVDVRGPVGRFKYQANSYERIGLVAGGTGLTPCLQVIRTVLESNKEDMTNFTLFFQNRTEEDILLSDELEALQGKYSDRLEIFYFLSNASTSGFGKMKNEVKGYISFEMVEKYMLPARCPLVCICGPSGFNEYVKGKLSEAGHTSEALFVW